MDNPPKTAVKSVQKRKRNESEDEECEQEEEEEEEGATDIWIGAQNERKEPNLSIGHMSAERFLTLMNKLSIKLVLLSLVKVFTIPSSILSILQLVHRALHSLL